MAIGHLYTNTGGVTIMNLGPATAENYRRSGNKARTLLRRASDKAEREIIGGMISECDYVSEWLETGRRPGNRRGIERRSAYQRERPMDPLVMQAYIGNRSAGGSVQVSSVTDEDRSRIDNVLGQLTERERDAYVSIRGMGLPFSEVARLMGIEKGSVQSLVQTAEAKIQRKLFQGDLFDFL